MACSPSCRGLGWGAGTGTWEQGRSLPCHTGQNAHRDRATNSLGKGKGERAGVFMPPQLCPCCSSLLNVLPIYRPHLLSDRSLSFLQTLVKCHLHRGVFPGQQNEWSPLSASRNPLFNMGHSALPPSVSMSDPHLDWGHPEGRRVVALNVQHRTQDHSPPQCLLSEEGGGGQVHKLWGRLRPWPGLK